jgi:hypothetical protein
VRFPIRRFPKLVASYVMDRSTLSNQTAIYGSEREPRLEALRRLFDDDPFGRRYKHLEARAFAGYFLRYAGMFIRMGELALARESFDRARAYWPACADDWIEDGAVRMASLERHLMADVAQLPPDPSTRALRSHLRSPTPASCAEGLRFLPAHAEQLRMAWLHYTVNQPFNVWRIVAASGVRQVALFGGEGWGLAVHHQLASAGLTCVAVIDNNASTREAAMVPVRYFSLAEYLASGPRADAVLSSLQGDHDRDILPALQREIGPAVPVVSWKMLFSLLAEHQIRAGDGLETVSRVTFA